MQASIDSKKEMIASIEADINTIATIIGGTKYVVE